ncbi:hypothetical protein GNI_170460 [Gregarina niphandrodes]|uniref:Uncharacterized protein n=1 Tax=Gregarina niphandrodes TaxID=110365 RepID=A0A023AYH0_GRENI|nr:hypothetical protein GNI_170460 [Gregarina niphandrodes]EZG43478.1 hypothetical protein GNI_170460 [Gregarina niphandrodes]|eukprot:XP_011133291.1 hypothetical protein GNI_170460 [Gregarina niphandrodes]
MRSIRGSSVVEGSSLAVVLSVSLLGTGDSACGSFDSQGGLVVSCSAARTPRQDEALRLPKPLKDCVRLDWSSEHRMTPDLFLSIGLQCLAKMKEDKDLRLRSVEQIQFNKKSAKILVEIDRDHEKYTAEEGVAMNWAGQLEQVLSKLATYVTCVSENDPAEVTAVLKRYAQSTTVDLVTLDTPVTTNSLGLDRKRTLAVIEEELLDAYNKLQPGTKFSDRHWRGVCRPRLGLNAQHQVAVVSWLSGFVCPECRPQDLKDLRYPTRIQDVAALAAASDGAAVGRIKESDGTGSGRDWQRVADAAAEEVRKDADAQGLGTQHIPLGITWQPWKEKCVSNENAGLVLQDRLERGCIMRLYDLLKLYRLSHQVTDSLLRQLKSRLGDAGKYCCVGSYSQLYVILEQRVNIATEETSSKLLLLLAPECMRATTKERAAEVTQQFIKRFKRDAGYDAPRSESQLHASVIPPFMA